MIAAVLVFLSVMASAGASAAFAAQPPAGREDSAAADAIVAELRDLPLPLEAFPRGIASREATQRPLPALEQRRQRVYDELHALGPASVPALARALRDPDADMRRDVLIALDVLGGGWWQFPGGGAKLDIRPALPALVSALGDSDSGVRAWAAEDIGDIGAAAVPPLRVILHSQDATARASACSALGKLGAGAGKALPELRQALSDPSPDVRQAARRAIGSIAAPPAP